MKTPAFSRTGQTLFKTIDDLAWTVMKMQSQGSTEKTKAAAHTWKRELDCKVAMKTRHEIKLMLVI